MVSLSQDIWILSIKSISPEGTFGAERHSNFSLSLLRKQIETLVLCILDSIPLVMVNAISSIGLCWIILVNIEPESSLYRLLVFSVVMSLQIPIKCDVLPLRSCIVFDFSSIQVIDWFLLTIRYWIL